MKKFNTLSFVIAGALMLIASGLLRPAFAGTYFDTASIINVSSQTASPTTLLSVTNGSDADVRIICTQLNNANETIMLQSASTGFSTSATTGTARVPCLPASVQQLDFELTNYRGPLYAVANATYTIPVNIWRKR